MIAKGKLAIIPTVFSFTEFLNFLELTYSTRAKQKGLAFNLKADKKIPEYLEGDRLRLLQVLTNLCDNAIKYTEKGGISLEVELNQKWANTVNLRFAVKDTGQGISKENVELIFESFEQLGGNKGAGLGLPIVRGILNLMGSEVRLDSKINSGSTFYFDIKLNFPLKPVENFTPKPKTKRKKIVSKKKILLVEDDELIQMTLFKILVDSGDFFIDCLSDGAMVMEEVINNGYDLILMDVNLPNVQGDQLATVIRSLPFKNIKKTPIIGVTANSYSQDQKAYLKAGMNTVITKPNKNLFSRTCIFLLL